MKIGIDARFFGPPGKGLGRYTEKLVKNLEKIDFENQYSIFMRRETWNDYQPENPNFKKVLADLKWYSLSEQIFLPRILSRKKLDLIHFPHFNVPIFFRGNFVVTIHDLILLKFPTKRATTLGPIKYLIKYWGYKKTIINAVKSAKRIIAVSNYTKSEISDYFKINPEKICVIYEAADSVEWGQLTLPTDTFLKKHKITKPYLLYVGNAYPHKNLERLLSVFKKLKDNFRPIWQVYSRQARTATNFQQDQDENFPYQLVLVGKEDYFYRRLHHEAKNLKLLKGNDVIFFGFATQKELAALYRQASLYIFPSYVEGFGLPPLEAASYGIPVAAAKSSSLPEILGEAALYFDPYNEKEMAEIIFKAVTDELLRQKLHKKGFLKVKEYSWLKCAKETKEVYESIGKN
ncbi:MAG: glycosyltransferase family 1 protein [Patescibacteria group bacterium]